jgi:hypothetical protein
MPVSKLAVALAAPLLLGGCFTVSYRTETPGSGRYQLERGDFFFWGLAGEKTLDMRQVCPEGVSRWRSYQSFSDGVIAVATLGLYMRRHIQVECAADRRTALERDPAGQAAVTGAAPGRAP